MSFERARAKGLTSSLTFPRGNLCPEGSVIKSTSIDPSVVDADGVYRKVGPAKVFTTENAAIAAIKGQGPVKVVAGDVLVLVARGPMGSGMEEEYQVTSALEVHQLGQARRGADRRPVQRRLDRGVHRTRFTGGTGRRTDRQTARRATRCRSSSTARPYTAASTWSATRAAFMAWNGEPPNWRSARPRPDLAPDAALPDDTRLWAALQNASGGVWGGCVYDVNAIAERLSN